MATIGFELSAKHLKMADGKVVKAQIWDTVGQERYSSLTKNYYSKASGAILVYDVTDEKSF